MAGLPRETQDALVALYVVKKGRVSEAAIERLLLKPSEGRSLARRLVEGGHLTKSEAKTLLGQLDPGVIEGYRIEAEAGRGGMGVVYRARQLSMDRVVALKVLSRRSSRDAEFVAKFLAEARSAARLNHEHVVAAIDAGQTADGVSYFAMEFVDGESVSDQLDEDGPLPWQRTFEITEQIARALEHAHDVGIVHRDVKPENIMIAASGAAKLCDLGLARPAVEAGTGSKSATTEGTPYYCSPEQATGRTDLDGRTDIYSLGATIYHMLTGNPPYDGKDAGSIMLQQVKAPFPDVDKELPEVPPGYRELLKEMVVKDRNKRLGSMKELLQRLAELSRGPKAPRRGVRRKGGVGGLALAVTVLLLALAGWAVVLQEEARQQDVAEDSPVRPDLPDDPFGLNDEEDDGQEDPIEEVGPPPETPPLTDEERAAATEDEQAKQLYTRAVSYELENPDDYSGFRQRLQLVVDSFPKTYSGRKAKERLDQLKVKILERSKKDLRNVELEAVDFIQEHRFRDALVLIDEFEADLASAGGDDGGRLASLRQTIMRKTAERLDELRSEIQRGQLDEEEARAALTAFIAQATPQLADDARQVLADMARLAARERATRALAKLEGEVNVALEAGDTAQAQRLVERAKGNPALDAARAEADAVARDVDDALRAWQHFDGQLEPWALAGVDRELPLRSGQPLQAKVNRYDPQSWTLRIQPTGEEARDLPLDDLDPAWLLERLLPAADGRANALFLAARLAPLAAAAALDAFVDQGGQDDSALRARIQRLTARKNEDEADATLTRLLDPAQTPLEDRCAAIEALEAAVTGSEAYRKRHQEVVAGYQEALVTQLKSNPSGLFQGKVKPDKRDPLEVEIEYRFSDPRELEDWQADTTAEGQSRAVWEDKALVVRGMVAHLANFAPGELEIDLKIETTNDDRPNLNFILGGSGGWTGVLYGLGFIYGGMTVIQLDPSAPTRPGFRVSLPSNVAAELKGKPPSSGDTKWMASEKEPSFVGTAGRTHRLRLERNRKGDVRIKLRSATALAAPKLVEDAPGGFALAPGATQLEVKQVEIKGRLDEAWVEDRCRELAKLQTAKVPRPASK